ncbi:hypothetical protein [Rossellomorea aquimaris]|uniref:hypothetical protein n=1 Tax=Rossellomorea aquimaris TaxID=189382 RepID=UPI0007D08CCE|nr:hypothetical protein [Rossellomorea aquimaris]
MSKGIILVLIILILLICFYLMNRLKQQAVQVITLERFLQLTNQNVEGGSEQIKDHVDDHDEQHDGGKRRR